jgi:putative hydrolase of the HAD superfamily
MNTEDAAGGSDKGPAAALIVDFGGVLTTSIWPAFTAFCRDEGLPEGAVRDLFRNDPDALADLRQLETGECEPQEFEGRLAARLGIERSEGLIERLFAGLGPDEQMLAAVRAARDAGIKTGLISNSWGQTIYDPAVLEGLFDASVISGEVGIHKPQPEIFMLACRQLGVEPDACVFVDDLRENVAGAKAVGMTGILHRDTSETLARLEDLLGLELGARSRPGG